MDFLLLHRLVLGVPIKTAISNVYDATQGFFLLEQNPKQNFSDKVNKKTSVWTMTEKKRCVVNVIMH